jgi:hypothetical protein
LIILLSLPGIIALVSHGDWAQGLPWLPVCLAIVSGLLLVLGVILLWYGLAESLRFGTLSRFRFRRRG